MPLHLDFVQSALGHVFMFFAACDAVAKRLQASRDATLVVREDVLRKAVTESYVPAYGARPLRRWCEKQLGTALAVAVLEGNVQPGSTVTCALNAAGELACEVSSDDGLPPVKRQREADADMEDAV